MIRIALALVGACGSTPKRPTTNVADAIVSDHVTLDAQRDRVDARPTLVIAGPTPRLERWSGTSKVVLPGDLTGDGLADAVAIGDTVQLIVGRPARALGAAVPGAQVGTHFADAVAIGDLDGDGANELVVDEEVAHPPPGSVSAETPYTETFMTVVRGGARGLGKVLERIPWTASRRALLSSSDTDGDGKADLVTYQCPAQCTISARSARSPKLGPEAVLATWPEAQRVVVGAARADGYVIAAVEPQAIRTYVLERGALRERSLIKHRASDAQGVLFGPAAVGDFDRDGRIDIAVVTANNELLAWSDTSPAQPLALASRERVRTVAFVDLDRDGDDDLLVSTDDLVSMYRGSPAGLEQAPSWKARLR